MTTIYLLLAVFSEDNKVPIRLDREMSSYGKLYLKCKRMLLYYTDVIRFEYIKQETVDEDDSSPSNTELLVISKEYLNI